MFELAQQMTKQMLEIAKKNVKSARENMGNSTEEAKLALVEA